jgi:hypothetical protein
MVRFRLRLQLHEYELPPGLTVIGRGANCNLTIDDALLSRDHAAIRLSDARVTIRDLGSRNGTFVNGERITDDAELHDGDRIRVGTTEMIFNRTVSARRTVATTASVTTCVTCGSAYVVQAACCPHCGAAPAVVRAPRTESQQRRDFWLSLEVELLNKALEMLRYDEADEAARRLRSKLDELIALNKKFDGAAIEAALMAMVRLARVHGSGRTIGWTFEVMRRTALLPGPELFALIAATAPIVLEEAAAELQLLITSHSLKAMGPTEQSCLHSLKSLNDDLVAFGAMRMADTAPRSALATVSP